VFLQKNNIRFCRFISYMVRFWSKTMSKGLGKVDVLLIHYTLIFWFCVYKSNKKELKIKKQEKEECFANLKEREDSRWFNPQA
jgi:hypothetical protein